MAGESFSKRNFEVLRKADAGRVACIGNGDDDIDRREILLTDFFGKKLSELKADRIDFLLLHHARRLGKVVEFESAVAVLLRGQSPPMNIAGWVDP